MKTKFCICRTCGNLVGVIEDGGVPMTCCGRKMEELIPGTAGDAASEKHLPRVTVKGRTVTAEVGVSAHPMDGTHRVEWVYLHTDRGGHRKALLPGEAPRVSFTLDEEKPTAVFVYCNIHGLWRTSL